MASRYDFTPDEPSAQIRYSPDDPLKKRMGYHTPVYIKNQGTEADPDQASGYYRGWTDEKGNLTGDKINLNVPPESDFSEVSDALKHELVHQAVGRNYPKSKDISNFSKSNEIGAQFGSGAEEQPGPANQWNWDSWRRGGNPYQEMPAYMSVYREGMAQVGRPERDQYMKDFFNWQQKQGQSAAMKKIQDLLRGRESYAGPDPVGTGRSRYRQLPQPSVTP